MSADAHARQDAAPGSIVSPQPQAARPVFANAALLGVAGAGAATMLWLASSQAPVLVKLAAAVGFAFLGNTLFALMHEAVHGNFSSLGWLNALGGRLAAAFFPTSFTMQKAFHLTHHRNNRSDEERFDYVGPHDDVVLKSAQWYTILTGLYWASVPLFVALFSLFAELLPLRGLIARHKAFSRQTSADAFFGAALALPVWRVRLDAATTLATQWILIEALDVTLAGWALCYGAFGLAWSSLQYADHAFSRLDREEGAWNLRVSRVTRAAFLNYHFHLVHHRDPAAPWSTLPSRVRTQDDSVSFVDLLLLMWGGPRLLPGSGQSQARALGLDRASRLMQALAVAMAFALVYGAAAAAYPALGPYHAVRVAWDDLAPFAPWAGWIYATIAPLMACVAVMAPSSRELTPYAMMFLAQIFIAGVVFLAWPIAPFDAATLAAGGDSTGLRLARAIALRGNYLPSLHVAFAASSALICARLARSRLVGVAFLAWGAAIVVSTVVTRQHYLADVAAGAALGIGALAVVPPLVAKRMAEAQRQINAGASSA